MPDLDRRPPASRGVRLLGVLAAAFLLALLTVGSPDASEGGWTLLAEFGRAALSPATSFEGAGTEAYRTSFLEGLASAAGWTLIYAAAALTLALPLALGAALLAAESTPLTERSRAWAALATTVRSLLVVLRSLHELLWAVVLLAAMGISSGAAVVALALPLVGTLGRVFAELLDEVDGRGATRLEAAGCGPVTAFLAGRVPVALPDMAAYAFYRLECTLRSSAVLGFFGFPTLGYALRASFEERHYREVWTQLYVLIALVLVLEAWSAALRRRFVA